MLGRRGLLAGPALLLGGAAAGTSTAVAAIPISRMETLWWRVRHEDKLATIRGNGRFDVVWLGDSITQDWEMAGPEGWRDFAPVWQHYYGDRRALNLGFKGDTTAHLLWRMTNGELEGLRPKVAVVLIGANNMGRVHWTGPQTVAGIEAVVVEAQARLPGTRIVLVSVLPSVRSKYVTRTTEEVNRGLAARYGGGGVPGVTYVDVTELFMREGVVDRSQFLDDLLVPPEPPLHPTAQAQGRVAAAIEPVVAGVLGDRAKGAMRG